MKSLTTYQSIASEGGLLPADLLKRVSEGDAQLPGLKATDYKLHRSERLTERIAQSWLRLGRIWEEFKTIREQQGEHISVAHTYEEWVQHLLQEMGYGDLSRRPGLEIDGVSYPIYRFENVIPVHVVPATVLLDKRQKGVIGAARKNPHGMVQEYLNRTDEHLWAVVTNGMQLRILRDNEALSRPAYLEFDVEAIFDGELYAEFVVMWLTVHATRGEVETGQSVATCIWEQWTQSAEETGTRALEDLRSGVQNALQELGQGLVEHPKNNDLRERLRSGEFTHHAFHNLLLRKIYRLLFLFVAEDRDLLKDADADDAAYLLYKKHYSSQRWRELADQIRGSRHHDLWEQLMLVVGALSGDVQFEAQRQALGLTALGSSLWSIEGTDVINGESIGGKAVISNERFLSIMRNLAFTQKDGVHRSVDFRNLGSEELGSVYEGLLALTPRIEGGGSKFYFEELSGNQRKTSGSYYTPDSLVKQLLSTALAPVVQEKLRGLELEAQESALLSISVCDPSVGSGHFLVGAAHYLAEHLGSIRALTSGEDDATPAMYQQALRDVISHCLYGVDLNPMAVELCKVTLWMESMEPGKPLSFLDHHIRLGNSLIGAPADAFEIGIPDGAFKGLDGDDKTALKELKKINRNRGRASIASGLFANQGNSMFDPRAAFTGIENLPSESIADIQTKVEAYAKLRSSKAFKEEKAILDAWTAAFFYPKSMELQPVRYQGITNDYLDSLAHSKAPSQNLIVDSEVVEAIVSDFEFFHWHLEFPLVFSRGGFDVMHGNPPWGRVKIQSVEWFQQRVPSVNEVSTSAGRKKKIAELEHTSPILFQAFKKDEKRAQATGNYLRHCGVFDLGAVGDVNYANVFANLFLNKIGTGGAFGAVLPSGVVTGDTMKGYFQHIVQNGLVRSFFDFENKGLFDADSRLKFGLLTCMKRKNDVPIEFSFFRHDVSELKVPENIVYLDAEDIQLLNPNTQNCPVIRNKQEAEILKYLYRKWPVLLKVDDDGNEVNPWGVKFGTMFHMSNDSHLFRESGELESEGFKLVGNKYVSDSETYLPLYEGKMIELWNHRAADVIFSEGATSRKRQPRALTEDELKNPNRLAQPFSWLKASDVEKQIPEGYYREAFFGVGNVSSPTNSRACVGSLIPKAAVGHSISVWYFREDTSVVKRLALFQCLFSSLCFDFIVRCKMGDVNLTKFLQSQIALPSPDQLDRIEIQSEKSLKNAMLEVWRELSVNSFDLADSLKQNRINNWENERRFDLRIKNDIFCFLAYFSPIASDITRDAKMSMVNYIIDSFPILAKREHKVFGEFKSKRLIMEGLEELLPN